MYELPYWGMILSVSALLWFISGRFVKMQLLKVANRYDEDIALKPLMIPDGLITDGEVISYKNNHREDHLRDAKRSLIFFQVVLVLVLSVVSAFVLNFRSYPVSQSSEHWGQFGDFLGGTLNPILAFASFIALLYTIRLQSAELAMSREELKRSANASEMSSAALDAQLKVLKREAFENTLFKLYDTAEKMMNEERNTLYEVGGIEITSWSGFSEELKHQYKAYNLNFSELMKYCALDRSIAYDSDLLSKKPRDIYAIVRSEPFPEDRILILPEDFNQSVGLLNGFDFHHIDFYLSTFKFLKRSDLLPDVWQVYIDMLKSVLDEEICLCIALYVNDPINRPFKGVVEEYGLLQKLIINDYTGKINFGLIGVEELGFSDAAFAGNTAYTQYIYKNKPAEAGSIKL